MPIRNIARVSRTYQHFNRYRQILAVLMKYGFEDLVDRLSINQYLEVGLQWLSSQRSESPNNLSTAERVRKTLEELGPTFIKLGQVLSTRPDVVPAEFLQELSKLQQGVPSFEFEQVREIVEQDLGTDISALFLEFEPEPIAAGSIGQVHRAVLVDGTDVVVKVQRPEIESTVEIDLEILLHLANIAEKHLDDWSALQPSLIVEQFGRIIERELDFTAEAAHLVRFGKQFKEDSTVRVPQVFAELTTRRVLTLEFMDVIPLRDRESLIGQGLDPELVARRGIELVSRQVFEHGFFHADPHPGNIFVLPDNVICLLDFGMVGRLDRRQRESLADLMYAIARQDPVQASTALLRITDHDSSREYDFAKLESDVEAFIDHHVPSTLAELEFGTFMYELLELLRRHELTIHPDHVAMLKAGATIEQLARRLAPDLSLIATATPYIRKIRRARYHPRRMFSEMFETGGEFVRLARDVPSGLRDLLQLARRGGLKIGFEHRGLERLIDANERIANHLSFAIVVAALIVGSSLIVHAQLPPLWHGIPVIGLVGYLAAGILGFMLAIAIIRHGQL